MCSQVSTGDSSVCNTRKRFGNPALMATTHMSLKAKHDLRRFPQAANIVSTLFSTCGEFHCKTQKVLYYSNYSLCNPNISKETLFPRGCFRMIDGVRDRSGSDQGKTAVWVSASRVEKPRTKVPQTTTTMMNKGRLPEVFLDGIVSIRF